MFTLPNRKRYDFENVQEALYALWRGCMTAAREHGANAEAVQQLITRSREFVAEHGGDPHEDADACLAMICTAIHHDWTQPSDRLFEVLLDFELTEYFRERGIHDGTSFS